VLQGLLPPPILPPPPAPLQQSSFSGELHAPRACMPGPYAMPCGASDLAWNGIHRLHAMPSEHLEVQKGLHRSDVLRRATRSIGLQEPWQQQMPHSHVPSTCGACMPCQHLTG
jgi:hypothetical protein